MIPRLFVFVLLFLIQVAFSGIPPQTKSRAHKQLLQQGDTIFKFTDQLIFEGKIVRGSIRKSEIDRLLDLRIELTGSGSDDKYGLELKDEAGNKFLVFTCREWTRELSKGSYAMTTYDMTMQAYFIETCGFLYALKEAKPSKKSFIAKPRIGLTNLNMLPVNVLSGASEEGEELEKLAAKGVTLSKLISKGEVRVTKKKRDRLWLTGGEMDTGLYEMGRADFDGDGIEDIFIFSSEYATSGSLRVYGYFLLTRLSHSTILKVKYPDPGVFKGPVQSATESELKLKHLTQTKVTKQEYGDAWPFSVAEGVVACAKIGSVAIFFTADSKTYALNGWARGRKIDGKEVSSDVAEIQIPDRDTRIISEGKSLMPIINKGFSMCR